MFFIHLNKILWNHNYHYKSICFGGVTGQDRLKIGEIVLTGSTKDARHDQIEVLKTDYQNIDETLGTIRGINRTFFPTGRPQNR